MRHAVLQPVIRFETATDLVYRISGVQASVFDYASDNT
jgi:hypothetical protein